MTDDHARLYRHFLHGEPVGDGFDRFTNLSHRNPTMTTRLQRPPRKASPVQIRPPMNFTDLDVARQNLQDDLATVHVERSAYDPALETAPPTRDLDGRPLIRDQKTALDWDQIPGYDAAADMPPVIDADEVTEKILASDPALILQQERPAQAAQHNISSDASEAAVGLEWNLDMDDAPVDGTPFIAMGRYSDAKAGFPRIACYIAGAFREPRKQELGEPLTCWAWISRDVLPAWPAEPK